jgi:hypothetical protein
VTDMTKAEALFKAREETEERIKAHEEVRVQAMREKTAKLRALRLARDAAQATKQ